jgi:hypothetical protein
MLNLTKGTAKSAVPNGFPSMSSQPRKFLLVLLLVLAVSSQGCAFTGPRPGSGPIALPTDLQPAVTEPAATPIPALQSDSNTPRVVPTAIYTPTPASVTITAAGGSLSIRTGPASVFDAIAVLQDGQSAPVVARSIQDGWVEIPILSKPGSLGWVDTKAGFSQLNGYVLDLPLITEVEWPFGAYLVNCTAHRVIAEPGDTVVPAVSAAPENRVWFTPGLYTVYDMDVAGRPSITQVKLFSHTTINLTKDASGQKYACP